ncbi:MAG: heavy metal translocating P-type ATPase, partial [Gemmatimonadota bacterium]|nr:heavy metal translocating P-type ATPase [Gemmatimonadota bacterium]
MRDAAGAVGKEEAEAPASETGEIQLRIRGMHCASCVTTVEKALGAAEGVGEASVSLVEEVARVRLAQGTADPATLVGAVEAAGYGAEVLAGAEAVLDAAREREEEQATERTGLMRRFRVGVACGLPVVLFGHWEMIPGLPELAGSARAAGGWLSGLLTLPILLYTGRGFFTGAWTAARRRSADMDTLVALGTGAAWLYSTVAIAAPHLFPGSSARPFYEAVAVVITLVVLGQAIEARARGRTARALRSLFDLSPETADRVTEDGVETVPVGVIVPGDVFLVRPGARVPLDGEVRAGESEVDESMISGESAPVGKSPGDGVVGGTVNGTGALTVETTRVGADTVLARIVDLVQRAQGTKPPIQRTVDVIAGRFVPAVILVSLVTFTVWALAGPEPRLNFAVVTSVAVLVIACPCALGLATPISVMIAVGKAAAHGVLIRDGEALQRARRVDTIVLDKTGTLTVGRPSVAFAGTAAGVTESELIEVSASVEAASEHPAARAIVRHAEERGGRWPRALHFVAHPGRGASASVAGSRVLVGSPAFAAEAGVELGPVAAHLDRAAREGATPVVVVLDGAVAGVFGVSDVLRAEARGAVGRLRRGGVEVMMLTGDEEAAARRVAGEVGIDRVSARVSPDGKARVVRGLRDEGRVVAMVGDGINDAPALATADVGIAMGSGTDVALQTGDVALLGDSLRGVETLLDLSGAAHRNIVQNLVGAFAYNVIGIPVAAGVLYPSLGLLLSPMIAGAAMAFSSVTVVANANRLRGYRPAARGRTRASTESGEAPGRQGGGIENQGKKSRKFNG